MAFGDVEYVATHPRKPGDFSDLYALTTLRCSRCSAIWKQFRLAGQSLQNARCVRCNRRSVEYHEGEPGAAVVHHLH